MAVPAQLAPVTSNLCDLIVHEFNIQLLNRDLLNANNPTSQSHDSLRSGLVLCSHVSKQTYHFGQLYQVTLRRNVTHYIPPWVRPGPTSASRGWPSVSEAPVSDNPAVCHTSVANKWKTSPPSAARRRDATQIRYNLTFQSEDDRTFSHNAGCECILGNDRRRGALGLQTHPPYYAIIYQGRVVEATPITSLSTSCKCIRCFQ
ncbi:hypothetical protein COCON_G00232610 [Conger conger]|uniref:Uncharacterized protein n=1 Tax=Conger conger TaxID=82655 RepID=A0A9Q1CVE0_CONCO|nr:hypothetical protein COCON_G00232610 [Conger conger]